MSRKIPTPSSTAEPKCPSCGAPMKQGTYRTGAMSRPKAEAPVCTGCGCAAAQRPARIEPPADADKD